MMSRQTTFISFGHRCSTAALLDRCQLAGESLPFDSLVCQLSVVKDCLATGFKHFLDVNNYIKSDTETINSIDGDVHHVGRETPSVNTYYARRKYLSTTEDLYGNSTYHQELALTHHDLTSACDYEAYTRRIQRLYTLFATSQHKTFVYIHPVFGGNEYEQKKSDLIEEFRSFSLFVATETRNISGLFIILVMSSNDCVPTEQIQLLNSALCKIHTVFVNRNFIDAGGPFSGDCEREIQVMTSIIKEASLLPAPKFRIYFPLFDHIESASNEMRLTYEGLSAHPQVVLVDRPEFADYLIFCQNHLVDHCPFHTQFRPIKDLYKERAILLDFDDDPGMIFDADDFRWRLYFKRSRVDRANGKIMSYGGFKVLPIAYGVVNDMCEPPEGYSGDRTVDVACLFDDEVCELPWFKLSRGRLLRFARRLASDPGIEMQLGTVSPCGSVGRSGIDASYKYCLYNSKIVLHANPDFWEGDARLWEALAAGALVFVDRMLAPMQNSLIDGKHLIFYDLTDEGMAALEGKIRYFLGHPEERQRIGMQGRAFVLQHHRSIDRVNQVISELESSALLDPTSSTSAARAPDVVVSIATGYKLVSEYRQFISTLRRTGATCPVLLGISDGPEFEAVKIFLLENAINYFIVPPISPPHKVVNGYRFEQYRKWLLELNFRYALIMDFRDAYFQRDPFEDVDTVMQECDLNLMSEFQFLTVGNHPNGMNYAWVAEPFGTAVADALADQVILNSGAILGRKSAVMAFLNAMAEQTARQNFEFADQGTLNYLAHGGHLEHCGRIKITRAGQSLVNNCGFTEIDLLRAVRPITAADEERVAFIPRDEQGRLSLYRDHEGWVLDDDGNISCAVHQYDRFSEMEEFVNRLADYDGPGHIYVNSLTRPYRSERYTLSTVEGLRPDALEKLVAMIKSLALDLKPILLVDAQFKRGFVFAYGILNTELLFESESMRQHFFSPASNAQKCDYFCRKWGYQAFFVDEAEIFLNAGADSDPAVTARGFREASQQASLWRAP